MSFISFKSILYYFIVIKFKNLKFYNNMRNFFLFSSVMLFSIKSFFFLRLFFFKNFFRNLNYSKFFSELYELFNIKVILNITALYTYLYVIFLFFICITFNFESFFESSFKLYIYVLLMFLVFISLVHIFLGLLGLFYDYFLKKFNNNENFIGFFWYRFFFLIIKIFFIISFLFLFI